MKHEGAAAIAADPPPAVVEVKMVESTEQDADTAIRTATVRPPFAMMRLAVCGWAIAAWPETSTISDPQRQSLLRREEATLTAGIKRIA